jgi:hypothetical protein
MLLQYIIYIENNAPMQQINFKKWFVIKSEESSNKGKFGIKRARLALVQLFWKGYH